MLSIEERVAVIEARNQRVAQDKAWEVSLTRRLLLAGIIYVGAALWLAMLEQPLFWLHALWPAVGYWLSTLTLGLVKQRWCQAQAAQTEKQR